MTPVFRGHCEGGRLQLLNRAQFDRYIATLNGPVEITVRRQRPKRSLSQNAYYHGVVVPMLAEHCGYDREEMHLALRFRFLREHHDDGMETARSTTELTTAEFTEYVEHCRRLAADYGVNIPDPSAVDLTALPPPPG